MCLFFVFTLSINISHMQRAAAILKGFFPLVFGGSVLLRAYSIDSAVERTSDAGPLHSSFIKLSERIASKVGQQ